ncbi:multicopper oxidase [Amniculicola lignicola CBS 123094]|uniref:laccase n=1 Tax=Amniculicola lignicola CBS 123094 TaxID=1392246 RepID=A0A6A5WLW0_9PLEO|nr:multicopper oxidase [Amniculicola lignicola CBS 123094]
MLVGTGHVLGGRKRATSTSATATSTRVADSACTNGPLTRNCWSSGFTVATDFDAKWPSTGKTVSYSLELKNSTCSPDGGPSRPCQLFNGQFPGPTITANWGDTISVTVKNSLTNNGTGIHWHGIRQLGTTQQDGVPGITECPLAPGDTKTYTFKATQFGQTWYHSHWSSQYGDGAFGSLVINGPASANYDYDLGPMPISDWYYPTAFQIGIQAYLNLQRGAAPPPADTILINGTNKNYNGGGNYNNVTGLAKGKKYRLRLINTSADNMMFVSLDNHNLTVISGDLVPIQPYTTQWVTIAVGQRYDVIFTANQAVGNYWFRAEVAGPCASSNNYYGRSVFSYSGATADKLPETSAFTVPTVCNDESPLVPWVKNNVSATQFLEQVTSLNVDIGSKVTTNGQNIVYWGINMSAINVDWDKPTLQYVKDGNTSYPVVFNLIEIPNEGTWSYWIIQETAGTRVPIPHPIHLHGHDYYVLGSGSGQFDVNATPQTLKYVNPMRRDTAILPAGGWLALAFPTDNPGAWLMHCHIAWHVADGFAVQFLESKTTMPLPGSDWDTTCANWNKYVPGAVYPKQDSGL